MTKKKESNIPLDKFERIKEIVLEQYKKGNVALLDPFMQINVIPLKEFVEQPADGILYDLNRCESVVLTFINDPKWINDYAVATVIRELKRQIEELESAINTLRVP